MASPTQVKVRKLQRTLYRTAKAEPKRRFHALYDKLYRSDVLGQAWKLVRSNKGAAGIDQVTIEKIEAEGVESLLRDLAQDLKDESYRVKPLRRVLIPKSQGKELRPLSIPTVKDRIVQAALKIVIEPIFEADFTESSFGYRPKKAPHDALQVVIDQAWRGRRWVVETDIASCFESIPHDRLIEEVQKRIVDRHILKLLRAMLNAGVMEDGAIRRSSSGTPQGGVISPLLANVYLNRLDRSWDAAKHGVLVRYVDDLVVMCKTRYEAEAALRALRTNLAELGLEVKEAKTQIVHLKEGGQGLDFLGFQHKWVRAKRSKHVCFLARWPSKRAMQSARRRIHEITAPDKLCHPVESTVKTINRFLAAWSEYFRYGNSSDHLAKLESYATWRLGTYLALRHGRRRRESWQAMDRYMPSQLSLVSLNGIVVAPRPNKPWRVKPNAYGKGRR